MLRDPRAAGGDLAALRSRRACSRAEAPPRRRRTRGERRRREAPAGASAAALFPRALRRESHRTARATAPRTRRPEVAPAEGRDRDGAEPRGPRPRAGWARATTAAGAHGPARRRPRPPTLRFRWTCLCSIEIIQMAQGRARPSQAPTPVPPAKGCWTGCPTDPPTALFLFPDYVTDFRRGDIPPSFRGAPFASA